MPESNAYKADSNSGNNSSEAQGYDLSVTTFSPTGQLLQLEYATRALGNSGAVIGIKCKDGIVMGVAKLRSSRMMFPTSNPRIHSIHRHCGMASAGLASDGRNIVALAKSEATNYERLHRELIPINELAKRIASYVYMHTVCWTSRPFGCGVILGGYDRDGLQLYMIGPSGIFYMYIGAAMGMGRRIAQTKLAELKLSEMTCGEGVTEVAKIIYRIHGDDKDIPLELEMSWICAESNHHHQKLPEKLLEEAKAVARDQDAAHDLYFA